MGVWYEDEITQGILHNKYLHEGEKTFEDLVERVSSIYSDDIKEEIKTALYNADFCPGGRTLYAAGMKNKSNTVVSNCFILGNIKEDTLESICEMDYEISRIASTGGGVGFAVDNIRPKGSKINNAARVSDGVAFAMRKINNTGQLVGQHQRHAALMCALDCNHPDIYEFLNIKKNHEALESMNISVKFDDNFMRAIVEDKEVELYFHVEATGEEIKRKIKAREFFEEFCKVNAAVGDPK